MLNDIERLQNLEKGLNVKLEQLIVAQEVPRKEYTPNLYTKDNPKLSPSGVWGGEYECPDGQKYVVGDHGNNCGTVSRNKWEYTPLAGIGGKIVKRCAEGYAGSKGKPGWGVICGKLKPASTISKEELQERELMLRQINDLVEIRMNLFQKIKNDYTASQDELVVQSKNLASQVAMVNIVETELNAVRQRRNKSTSSRDTQARMIEVGDYEFQKYEAHKSMIKVIFVYAIGILLLSVLIQIDLFPSGLGSVAIAVAFVACLITVIKRLNDMYSRSNMNYNQFKFSKPSTEGSTEDVGETVWEHDKRAFWENVEKHKSRNFFGTGIC